MDNVTPIRPGELASVPEEVLDGFQALESELWEIRRTLQCAVIALEKAESDSFQDEDEDDAAPAAISVAHRCVVRLRDLEEQFDAWRVRQLRAREAT